MRARLTQLAVLVDCQGLSWGCRNLIGTDLPPRLGLRCPSSSQMHLTESAAPSTIAPSLQACCPLSLLPVNNKQSHQKPEGDMHRSTGSSLTPCSCSAASAALSADTTFRLMSSWGAHLHVVLQGNIWAGVHKELPVAMHDCCNVQTMRSASIAVSTSVQQLHRDIILFRVEHLMTDPEF